MMKTAPVAAVAFLLGGTASMPRAANKDETLELLCRRFEKRADLTISMADTGLSDLLRGKPILDPKRPELAAKVWNPIELEQFAERKAIWVSLSVMRSVLCDK